MSNLAVKLPKRQQQERPMQPNRLPKQSPTPQPKKEKRVIFTGFEISVIGLFFISLVVFGFMYLSNTYTIYKENRVLQETKILVNEQIVKNKDLQTEVDRLSTYERIMTKAKELGLTINSENIKPINE